MSSRRGSNVDLTDRVVFAVVVPTIGRPTLRTVVHGLLMGPGPWPAEVVVVDDRRSGPPLDLALGDPLSSLVRTVRSEGRGPAAARNVGWRTAQAPWVVFLDDDVVPPPGWRAALFADVCDLAAEVGATQ